MPCRHGPRPTAWWRPTAPCSISMCGRFCGASMPRSTQASSGSRRNRCLTYPSWRRPKTSSANTKTRRPKQGLRQGRPFLPLRSSRLHRRKGRRSLRRTGERRLALRNLRSLHKCGLSLSLKRSRHRGSRSLPPPRNGRRSKGAHRRRHRARRLSRRRCRAPAKPHWRAREGPGRPAAASSQARAHAARRSPARGQAGEEGWPWKAIIKWGVVTLVILGYRRGAVDLARQAKSAWLRQRSRRARRQIDEQRRANRPQRSAEPKGRSPSRPLIASPDLLDFST